MRSSSKNSSFCELSDKETEHLRLFCLSSTRKCSILTLKTSLRSGTAMIEGREAMHQDDAGKNLDRRDFFISYTSRDRQWAEWIAMQLEEAGYTLFIQAWDFRPGSNFVAEMDHAATWAERTLLVLSAAYLESDFAFTEWAVALRSDPRGSHRRVLPVRVQPVAVDGLLGLVVFIDLVQLEEAEARERLLAGVRQGRGKPATVAFPGSHGSFPSVAFPGSLPAIWNVPFARNPFF